MRGSGASERCPSLVLVPQVISFRDHQRVAAACGTTGLSCLVMVRSHRACLFVRDWARGLEISQTSCQSRVL